MAEQDKKLTEMQTAEQITATDLEYLCVTDQQSGTGFSSRKTTTASKALAYLQTIEFPLLLNTTEKNIIGAINELEQGGGGTASILTGTTAPSSSLGSNGNLYVQYTEGTGGASDVFDAMYVKLDGEWIQIETGGTSETILIDTLEAGETSITFTDASITTGSNIRVLTSVFGIAPTAASASTGSLTLTFASQASDLEVKVVIY